MTPETFRAVVEGILLCNLVATGAVGVFVIFALESRVSRRDDYLRSFCHGLNLLRNALRDPPDGLDDRARAYLEGMKRVVRDSRFRPFFEPTTDLEHAIYDKMRMEEFIRFMPDRYKVLRRFVTDALREGRRHRDVVIPKRERVFSVFVLSRAWYASESFERGLGDIKRQIWLPWIIGLTTAFLSLLALRLADTHGVLIGQLLMNGLLGLLLTMTAAEFVAITVSAHRILYGLDR